MLSRDQAVRRRRDRLQPEQHRRRAGAGAGAGRQLAERAPELPVQLRPTERAGHGREIARDAARGGPPAGGVGQRGRRLQRRRERPDGGRADTAYAAVLAAGNANDHRRVTRERPLADAIVDGDVSRLDLLRMSVDDGREPRYAHSYIGLGITPTVALELEKGGKGSIKEVDLHDPDVLPVPPVRDRDRRRARRASTASSSPTSARWRSSRCSATRAGRTTGASR